MQRYPYKICHLLLGSSLMFVSGIISVENANAEPILAVGKTSECIINKQGDGTLAANSDNTVLSSLDTTNGGDAALITIDCLGSTDISISAPVRDGGNGTTVFPANGLSATATSTKLVLNINNNASTPQKLTGDPAGQIRIDMVADNKGQVISPGEYKFKVTLTVAPD
jgi:hypothetical protein